MLHSQRASVCLFCLCTLAGPFLHAAPRVVAAGNPALTDDMVTKAAGFFEWLLDIRFTPSQQLEYENRLMRSWGNPVTRKSTLDLLQNVDKLNSVSEERKQQVRASVLDAMRHSNDEDSRWMLAVYETAHSETRAVSGDGRRLVGKWRATKSASVQYRSSTTGALAPTNGSSFFYQFNADGTYLYNGLMQVTTYGCSTRVYGNESGRYSVTGDRLVIEPARGVIKTEQNCGSSGSTEKPANLEKRESVFHFETDSSGTVTLVLGSLKGNRPDYFRAES